MDRISRYRVARLSLFPPQISGGPARYALVANTIRNGVPSAQILCDGTLLGVATHPTTEEVLEALDAAVRQHMLR
jgi:hypothetical protein